MNPTDEAVNNIMHYDIRLYALDAKGNPAGVKYQDQGISAPPEAITLDGYSRDICVDLAEYWAEILRNHIREFQTDITTRETIIKFGDTQQLVNHYQLQINVTFSDS
jgi:hypothetical protein